MLLEEDELKRRIESPMNLLNRLKQATNPHSSTALIPSLPPSADDIIEDLQDKITIGSIKGKALGLMSSALDELKGKITEVSRPEKLSQIAADMSRVIDRAESRKGAEGALAQIIIYAPQIRAEGEFDIIEMTD